MVCGILDIIAGYFIVLFSFVTRLCSGTRSHRTSFMYEGDDTGVVMVGGGRHKRKSAQKKEKISKKDRISSNATSTADESDFDEEQQYGSSEDRGLIVYHEKQKLMCCAVHSVNNLVQGRYYTKRDFEKISKKLWKNSPYNARNMPDAWFFKKWFQVNPHKSPLGFGFYDENVLLVALQKLGAEGIRFDKRKQVTAESLDLENLYGIIVNSCSRFSWSRHWFCIRKIGDRYYNLDSQYQYAAPFRNEQHLLAFLSDVVTHERAELIKVYRPPLSVRMPLLSAPTISSSSLIATYNTNASSSSNSKTTTATTEIIASAASSSPSNSSNTNGVATTTINSSSNNNGHPYYTAATTTAGQIIGVPISTTTTTTTAASSEIEELCGSLSAVVIPTTPLASSSNINNNADDSTLATGTSAAPAASTLSTSTSISSKPKYLTTELLLV